jgi:heat shock protein HslJ
LIQEVLMNMGRRSVFAAAFTVALSACGGPDANVVGTGGDRVTATATYREAAALPADAELEAWIADASAPSATPATTALIARGTVPMRERETAFALRYDGHRIEDDHTYVLKAVMRSGGRILYTTDADTLVITRGHSSHAVLVLRPVVQTPTASVAPAASAPAPVPGLSGSSWQLEDLAGTPAVSGVEATLEFLDGDRVAGNASCNRFTGTVKASGSSITIGPLAATRMACTADAANDQEAAYLRALNEAERFVLEGTTLQIFSKGQAKPLRLARKP